MGSVPSAKSTMPGRSVLMGPRLSLTRRPSSDVARRRRSGRLLFTGASISEDVSRLQNSGFLVGRNSRRVSIFRRSAISLSRLLFCFVLFGGAPVVDAVGGQRF